MIRFIIILLILLLSSCVTVFEHEDNIIYDEPINRNYLDNIPNEELTDGEYLDETSNLEDEVLHSKIRQPVIISQEQTGIIDEFSIFAFPLLIPFEGPAEGMHSKEDIINAWATLKRIYRTVYPRNSNDLDVFEELAQELEITHNQFFRHSWLIEATNDVLLSFLLTEESIYMTDEELYEQLSSVTLTFVSSHQLNSVNYRIIGIDHDLGRFSYDRTWSYFVQVWNDEYIWAQPLVEETEIRFTQALFIINSNNEELLLLNGFTRHPNGQGFVSVGSGFVFEYGIWRPIVWDEVFSEVTPIENLGLSSDGITMTVFPPSYGVEQSGRIYRFSLTDDGSFWAEFSLSHPSDNPVLYVIEDPPPNEMLFKLK